MFRLLFEGKGAVYVARGRSFADYIRRLLYELNHLKLYRVSIHARVAGVLH